MTTQRLWTRWAALLALTAILAACGPAVTPNPEPAANPDPVPAARQASCDDVAISVLERGAGVHGAIVSDTLHMGGATAPATCTEPTNESLLAGLSLPEDLTAQVQQSRYYLIVIRYPGGNRLYIVTRRGDGTSCVVDLNDKCIAQVTDLPDDFDLETLPDDVAPTIPAGRPVSPPPTPSEPTAPSDPPTPSEPTAPSAAAPGAPWYPSPRDGATNVDVDWAAFHWEAGDAGGRGGPRTTSFDVYWGTTENLAADAELDTPIRTTTVRLILEQRLAFDTTYYWRVDANNAAGTTRGNVWSFTTRTAPAPPPAEEPPAAPDPPAEEPPAEEPPPGVASNPQPRDGATGVTVWKTAFNWDAAPRARYYEVYFGTSQDLAGDNLWFGPRFNDQFTGWSFTWSANLEEETTYYWRVDPKNEAGITQGNVWSFTTGKATGTLPGVASNPRRPRDGATDVRGWRGYSCTSVGEMNFEWDPAPGGVGYFVYIGTVKDLTSDNILTARGIRYSPYPAWTNGMSLTERVDFTHGTTYYWRVDAKNEAGITQGNVWSFTTKVWDTDDAVEWISGGGTGPCREAGAKAAP